MFALFQLSIVYCIVTIVIILFICILLGIIPIPSILCVESVTSGGVLGFATLTFVGKVMNGLLTRIVNKKNSLTQDKKKMTF